MLVNINDMTIAEKIKVMEILWNDICQNVPDFPSPAWHEVILKEREQNLKDGKDEFLDWEKSKQDIWNSVR